MGGIRRYRPAAWDASLGVVAAFIGRVCSPAVGGLTKTAMKAWPNRMAAVCERAVGPTVVGLGVAVPEA